MFFGNNAARADVLLQPGTQRCLNAPSRVLRGCYAGVTGRSGANRAVSKATRLWTEWFSDTGAPRSERPDTPPVCSMRSLCPIEIFGLGRLTGFWVCAFASTSGSPG